MKNILISGYYGFGNIGDEAILSAMIEQIKSKIPDCNIIVTSYNIEETKRLHEVEGIDRLNFNAISQEIEKSDLVILGGGGLFQDYHRIEIASLFTQPGWGIASYAIVPLIAKMHNKPVLYYSQGIGPLFSTESRTFVAFVSELADMITVRDKVSEDILKEVGVPSSKIKLGLDPAVGLEIPSTEKIKNILMSEGIPDDKEIVCVSVRQWVYKFLEVNYKKALSEALDDFLSNNEFYLLFLPFQNMAGGGEDAKVAEEIIEGMRNKDRCYLLKGSYHPREIAGIISKASLVIGMRYHSIIFSFISKVPFVALSYDPKVKNLVDELELGEYCVEIDAITSEDVSERIIKALTDREKIRKKLESALKNMKERLEVSSSLVQAFIEGSAISDVKTDITDILTRNEKKELVNLRGMVSGLEKQLKDNTAEIVNLQETVAGLESQIEIKDQEKGLLQETLRQRESSLAWRLSQFYGRYFNMDSRLTRFILYFINKLFPSLQSEETDIYKQKILVDSQQSKSKENWNLSNVYFGETKVKISVVLPVYNQAYLLEESIQSVLNQTYKNFELIIVNDGSTDDIKPILDKYAHHPKVLILTQEHQKLPKALTTGFMYASGEFYTWTSADNIMRPKQLEEQVKFLEENPDVDMVYCDYEAIDDRGKPLVNSDFRVHNQKPKGSSFIHLPRSIEQLNLEKDNFIGGCFMYRGRVGKIIGEYDPFAFGCEDYDYWMRINSLFTIKHLGKDDILYRFRVHDNTLNAKAKEFGIFERVEKLMQYDKERRRFYEDKFDIFCVGEDSKFNGLETFYRASGNNVVHIRNIEDIKNRRNHKKCVIFTNEFLFGDSYQSIEKDKDIFKIMIIEEDINEYGIDERAFESCDWIITLTINSFDTLFSKYKEKLLYLPSYDEKSLNILLKLANNRIFYRLTRPVEKPVLSNMYLSRKLNILIETATLDKGGLEQVIFDVATKIDKTLFNVYIACLEKDGHIAEKCRKAGIPVFLINKNKKKYENLIQKLKIDLVNSHYSLFGLDVVSKFDIPVVSVLHNNYIWLSESDKLKFKNADKHIKKYIAVSKNVSRYSQHYFGISPQKIELIPNGINIEAYETSSKNLTKTRRDFNLDDDDYVFLNVAAYHGAKGHNLMISAMVDLIKRYPKMKIICIGPARDDIYYNKIRNDMKSKKLDKNIIFNSYISDEDLISLYQTADAFLLPSLYEGWSMSTMEAMLYGLPMILTDVGGSREVIENNDIGIVIPNSYGDITNLNISNIFNVYEEERPSNTDDLKAAMINFYENREKWKEAGEKGIEKVRKKYDLNNIIHKYEALFVNVHKNIMC
jgi:polysaccharide pyruvyl transferase CsaB